MPPRQIWRRALKTAIAIRGIVAIPSAVPPAPAVGATMLLSANAWPMARVGKIPGHDWFAATGFGKHGCTAGDAMARLSPAIAVYAIPSVFASPGALLIPGWCGVATVKAIVFRGPPAITEHAVRRAIAVMATESTKRGRALPVGPRGKIFGRAVFAITGFGIRQNMGGDVICLAPANRGVAGQ